MTNTIYLHQHPDFADLISIVANYQKINDLALVEKDYWIMHCLYALQKQGFQYELKGGTSLSKAYQIIDRFSEDIDICIHPSQDLELKTGTHHNKPVHIEARDHFYQDLCNTISIDGIVSVVRDHEFDDEKLRSAGIRLHYNSYTPYMTGIKDGILLEVGFDNVTPYQLCDISSWLYDFAHDKADIIDNRALQVACYHPAYTFVEKLQAISTKYRKKQETGAFPKNFIRHYYDVYKLLEMTEVQDFIGTETYHAYKNERFPKADNIIIADNDAFILHKLETQKIFADAYNAASALYYREHPPFDVIMRRIAEWLPKL